MALCEQAGVASAVVVVDGSIYGLGVVTRTHEWACPWATVRDPQEQQHIELEALARGVELASSDLPPDSPLLLAGDNLGALYVALSGAPASEFAAAVLARVAAALRGPLWLAYVASKDNIADEPSRARVASHRPKGLPTEYVDVLRRCAVLAEWTCARPAAPA